MGAALSSFKMTPKHLLGWTGVKPLDFIRLEVGPRRTSIQRGNPTTDITYFLHAWSFSH